MEHKNNTANKLEKTITEFRKHYFFRLHSSLWRIILVSLIRGLASGLGWIIGATILVSLLTYVLSQIEFIPILGDWVSQIINEIEKFDKNRILN